MNLLKFQLIGVLCMMEVLEKKILELVEKLDVAVRNLPSAVQV